MRHLRPAPSPRCVSASCQPWPRQIKVHRGLRVYNLDCELRQSQHRGIYAPDILQDSTLQLLPNLSETISYGIAKKALWAAERVLSSWYYLPSSCPDDVVRRKKSEKESSTTSMTCIMARDYPKRLK